MIPKISLWVLLALGIICSIMFFVGGSEGSLEVAGDFLNIPRFTNLFLTWNYILVALVCLCTLFFVIWEFVKTYRVDKKAAFRKLGVVVAFVVLIVICWVIGSPEEVKIIGYEGTDNEGVWAQLSDAVIYMCYTLVVATLGTMAWGIVRTKTLK